MWETNEVRSHNSKVRTQKSEVVFVIGILSNLNKNKVRSYAADSVVYEVQRLTINPHSAPQNVATEEGVRSQPTPNP
ncbi:MAG: hypothetical protein F6K24_49410 [Okeania sp. SIO2D1]|nr:hypothetical protein [Okeania sp. SIO2D1]